MLQGRPGSRDDCCASGCSRESVGKRWTSRRVWGLVLSWDGGVNFGVSPHPPPKLHEKGSLVSLTQVEKEHAVGTATVLVAGGVLGYLAVPLLSTPSFFVFLKRDTSLPVRGAGSAIVRSFVFAGARVDSPVDGFIKLPPFSC